MSSGANHQITQHQPDYLWLFLGQLGLKCIGPFVDANSDPIIAIFTIVLAWSTIGLWGQTRRLASGAEAQAEDTKKSLAIAKTSADAAVASTRPWVRIDAVIDGPLTTYDDGVIAELRVSVLNTGRSPAFDVDLTGKIVPTIYGMYLPNAIKELRASTGPSLAIFKDTGVCLFPNETYSTKLRCVMTEEHFSLAKAENNGATVPAIIVGASYRHTSGDAMTLTVFSMPTTNLRSDHKVDWNVDAIPAENLHLVRIPFYNVAL
jgi:hypothetical protein